MSYGSSSSNRQQSGGMAGANKTYAEADEQYAPNPSNSEKQYAESTFSTDTAATERPLLGNSSSSKRPSRAWNKTKQFLSSLGEPPTAEYDRQQAAKAKAEGREPGQPPEEYYLGMDFGYNNQRPFSAARY